MTLFPCRYTVNTTFLVLESPIFNQMITRGFQASPSTPNSSKIPITILQDNPGKLIISFSCRRLIKLTFIVLPQPGFI